MPKNIPQIKVTNPWKKRIRVAVFVILCVVVYGLVPQIQSLRPSFGIVADAHLASVTLAVAFSLATYALTALIYVVLSPKRLRYGKTLLVQYAAASLNRLIPAGFGGMGANIAYLHAEKLRFSEALATATLNNVSGIVGHMLLFVVALTFMQQTLAGSNTMQTSWLVLLVVVMFALTIGLLLIVSPRLRSYARQFFVDIRAYSNRKTRLAMALLLSICVTLSNAASIWLCCQAVGVHISAWEAFLVLTGGVGAGAAVPTPGAVGAFEAGMYAVLVTLNSVPAEAFAAVLLFRLITYWLPLIAGSPILIYCQKKRYFGVSL
jgi:glycosyltransferase 2 family protein